MLLNELIYISENKLFSNSLRWGDRQMRGLDKDKVLKTIPYLTKWVRELKKDQYAKTIGHRLPSKLLDEIPDDLQDFIDGALYILGMEQAGGNNVYLVMDQ